MIFLTWAPQPQTDTLQMNFKLITLSLPAQTPICPQPQVLSHPTWNPVGPRTWAVGVSFTLWAFVCSPVTVFPSFHQVTPPPAPRVLHPTAKPSRRGCSYLRAQQLPPPFLNHVPSQSHWAEGESPPPSLSGFPWTPSCCAGCGQQ